MHVESDIRVINELVQRESAFVDDVLAEAGKVIVCLLYTSDAADEL